MLYLKGDWTNGDPAITAFSPITGATASRSTCSIRPAASPEVLPQILTADMVRRAVRASAPASSGSDG